MPAAGSVRVRSRFACLAVAAWLAAAPALGAEAGPACPLRLVEPPLAALERAAHRVTPEALAAARSSGDPDLAHLAVVVRWYADRGLADTERRTRATSDLFEIWSQYRPAARLMRIVGVGLAEEGWPSPTPDAVLRRLSQLGDRRAVLARAREVADATRTRRIPERVLLEALRGANVMAIEQDPEALATSETLLRALDQPVAAAETIVFRAEQGDTTQLARLGEAYTEAGPDGACAARATFLTALFPGGEEADEEGASAEP